MLITLSEVILSAMRVNKNTAVTFAIPMKKVVLSAAAGSSSVPNIELEYNITAEYPEYTCIVLSIEATKSACLNSGLNSSLNVTSCPFYLYKISFTQKYSFLENFRDVLSFTFDSLGIIEHILKSSFALLKFMIRLSNMKILPALCHL